jgi:predicted AlkP superfamily pyrophosphatase or phosphodiesterase
MPGPDPSSASLNKFLTALLLALLLAADGVAGASGSGGVNASEHLGKPQVVLISIDGFRWDFQALYETPNLDRIAAAGVRAESLVPAFPTLTFPNHYSIATGRYPARHELVDNSFFSPDRSRYYTLRDRNAVQDGAWYGADPIWVVAEKNGMVSAAFFFVGTEAEIQGIRPTYWKPFNGNVDGETRVDQVLEWLALPDERRPRLITLYFEDVDEATHDYGISSPAMLEAVTLVDSLVGRLLDGIERLPIADDVYLVLVSDHGQSHFRSSEPVFVLDEFLDLTGIRTVDHGAFVALYFDEPNRDRALAICDIINQRWRHGQAVVPGEAPDSWRLWRDSPFADVLVVADPKSKVSTSADRTFKVSSHGWSPDFRDMHGFFLAMGPRLPENRRIGRLSVVDVYPLLLEILDLPQAGPIDGDPNRLLPLLEAE